ncbi:MAG: HD domain-containing phosphohydrolase, partial [Burkholderiales bacterium]
DESTGVHQRVLDAVGRHHEREDGRGYPHGLKSEAIGIYGRIAGIVDTFVALTNVRPYAKTLSMHDALRSLYRWRGTQFHEPLVEQFVQAIGVFPVGSMVELTSGDVAIVLQHNRVRRLKPRVLLLTGPDKSPLTKPVPLDLLYAPVGGNGEEITIAHALPAGAYGIDPREFYLQ